MLLPACEMPGVMCTSRAFQHCMVWYTYRRAGRWTARRCSKVRGAVHWQHRQWPACRTACLQALGQAQHQVPCQDYLQLAQSLSNPSYHCLCQRVCMHQEAV